MKTSEKFQTAITIATDQLAALTYHRKRLDTEFKTLDQDATSYDKAVMEVKHLLGQRLTSDTFVTIEDITSTQRVMIEMYRQATVKRLKVEEELDEVKGKIKVICRWLRSIEDTQACFQMLSLWDEEVSTPKMDLICPQCYRNADEQVHDQCDLCPLGKAV